jgi:G3E family GTPase
MALSLVTAGTALPCNDLRPAVTVLSGFSPGATLAVARTLLADDPSLVVVRHDLSGVRAGQVHRIVRTGTGVLEDERVTLVHGCTSCTLREDVLPTLVRLARSLPDRDLVLVLPEAVDPRALAHAFGSFLVRGAPVSDALRVNSFVTVVDAERALADLRTTDDLIQREMHVADDDHRAVASVVARQIEYADTIVLYGRSPGDADATARLSVLLQQLAPWATHFDADEKMLAHRLRRTGRHRPDVPGVLARGLEGMAVVEPEPVPERGVVSAVFRARRPFHPRRLHRAFESVTTDVLRSRGHLWIASQPELAISWESAGGRVAMGPLGLWLAAMPDSQWDEASEQRRLAAAMEWDPYYGDRNTHLVFVGLDLDPVELDRRLCACLLTDTELAAGEDDWRTLSDPFAGVFASDNLDNADTLNDADTLNNSDTLNNADTAELEGTRLT